MTVYTESFFDERKQGSYNSAKKIIPLILELAQPKSVIDVGCGTGTWLSVFKEYGIEDIVGVDGDWVDSQFLEIPEHNFMPKDLTKPLELNRQFDLVVSLEVAEHLDSECADKFVDALVKLGSLFLFSAAIPFQGGRGHVNEQWSEYWIKRFNDRECVGIDCIRDKIWNNPNIKWWYSQNILLFVREECLPNYPLLQLELQKREGFHLMSNLVHPTNYLKKCKKYAKAIKSKDKELEKTRLKLNQTEIELQKAQDQLEKLLLDNKTD